MNSIFLWIFVSWNQLPKIVWEPHLSLSIFIVHYYHIKLWRPDEKGLKITHIRPRALRGYRPICNLSSTQLLSWQQVFLGANSNFYELKNKGNFLGWSKKLLDKKLNIITKYSHLRVERLMDKSIQLHFQVIFTRKS